ncbi:MAG: signal peptidase I [Dehalococcoidia bacterium]
MRTLAGLISGLISWLALGLLACLVAGLVFVALAPRLLGWQFIIVAGQSMEPSIQYGSVAVVERISGVEAKPGDVITFVDSGSGGLVTHRVLGYVGDSPSLLTKGDNNTDADPLPVPVGNVRGRFLFEVPHVGSIAHWMRSPEGYLAAAVVPGSLVILFELVSIVRTLRRRDDALPA